jgi:LPS sulfotransferase NodH
MTAAARLRQLIPARDAVVILGVQRSGTTLLAQDIASLGSLGIPGEHMLIAERSLPDREATFARLASSGIGRNGEVFAITLMINYLSKLGTWLAGEGALRKRDDLEDLAIRFFIDNFERVTFVTLRRDPLWHVAYSHWRVAQTNEYHLTKEGPRMGNRSVAYRRGDPVVPDPEGILVMLGQVIEKYQQIEALLSRHGITPLQLVFDEVVGEFPCYLGKVTMAAGRPEVDVGLAQRTMLKLTPEAETDEARAALIDYFRNNASPRMP